jgi:hypothetical protein
VALTAAVVGASLLLALAIYALPAHLAWEIVRENGLIEMATALAFAAAAGAAVWVTHRDRWWSGYAAAVVMAAAAARELDLHRRFTTVSVEKGTYLGFFASPIVPWPEKAVVGAVLSLLAAAAVTLVVRERWAFLHSLWARRPAAVATLGGLIALVAAQAFDKTPARMSRALPELALPWKLVEENLELAGAVLFLLALLKRQA